MPASNYTPGDPFKRCTKCGLEYPATLEYFHKNKSGRCGLHSECKTCHYKRNRKWIELHSDEYKKYQKNYHIENRHHISELEMLKYYKDPIPFQIRRKRYDNTPRGKATSKLATQRRISRKRSLPDNYTADNWLDCLAYWNGKCAYCGCQQGFWNPITAEHYIPISAPTCPGTVPWNIIPACLSCNSSKMNREVVQWTEKKFGKRKATLILKRIREYLNSLRA